jgi:hypothetical protein
MGDRPKPPLSIVSSLALSPPEPPATLGEPGRTLWQSVLREYDVSDVAGLVLLEQACHAADRAATLKAQIDADGEVVRTRGGLRAHPALKDELSARGFVTKILCRLGLNSEPLRAGPGRPASR